MVYYALFHSKLQYGIVCWGGTHNNKILPLLKSQKHAIRLICKKGRLSHCFPLFSDLKILPIRNLFFYKTLKVFYIKSGYLDCRRTITNYNLRINNCNLVSIPRFKKVHFSHSYRIIAPRIFNKLPVSLRNSRNLPVFLKLTKFWLLEKNYEEIDNLLKILE